MKMRNIMDSLNRLAPPDWQESWDKSGLQTGDPEAEIKKILVALDMDGATLNEALAFEADLVVTHHPLFFSPAPGLRSYIPEEDIIRRLVKADIQVFSAHTNLDAAPWGVNDVLARHLDLEEGLQETPLFPLGPEVTSPDIYPQRHLYRQKSPGFAALCLAETDTFALLKRLIQKIGPVVQINFSGLKPIHRIVLSGGSWDGSWLEALTRSKADAVITGEMKYHEQIACRERGIAVYTLGHGQSEWPCIRVMAEHLRRETDCTVKRAAGTDYRQAFSAL